MNKCISNLVLDKQHFIFLQLTINKYYLIMIRGWGKKFVFCKKHRTICKIAGLNQAQNGLSTAELFSSNGLYPLISNL
jgi:hypothetical protein